jgi:hypothetical protein
MPFTYSPHIISDPRAQEAAELSLIEHDLDHVIECCNLRLSLEFSAPSSMTIARAFSTSALITYRRCFTNGRRTSLSKDDLACLASDEMSEHETFLHLASKAHAHPVSANENGVVGISIGKDGAGGLRRAGLQYNAITTFDLGRSTESLLRLSKKVRDEVAEPKRKSLEKVLMKWLEDFADDELASWPSSLSAVVLEDDPLETRKKLNHRGR